MPVGEDIGVYGRELYDQVAPMHGVDPFGYAYDYVGAISSMAREIDELVRDTDAGVGWSALLDVDRCPPKGLPWLSLVRGVQLRSRLRIEVDRNYAIDPDARDATAWLTYSLGGATVTGPAVSTAWYVRGGTSVSYRAVSTATSTQLGLYHGAVIPVVAAQRWTAVGALRVNATPAGQLRIGFFFTNTGGAVIGTAYDTFTVANGAVLDFSTAQVAPAGAVGACLMVVAIPTATGQAFDVNVDSLMIQPRAIGQPLPTYWDPYITPGAMWLGAPNHAQSALYRDESDDEFATYARATIRDQPAARRGRIDTLRAALRSVLSGTKYMLVTERPGGDAYKIAVRTLVSESPPFTPYLRGGVKNPGAEFNATDGGWQGVNCTIGRSTAQAQRGLASFTMTISTSATASMNNGGGAGAHRPPAAAGEVWSAGAYIRSSSTSRSVNVFIEFFNASGAIIGAATTGPTVTSVTTGWTLAVVEGVTAPAGAASARVSVQVLTPQVTDLYYVDSLWLGPNATVPTGSPDGDTPGWEWQGAPQNSFPQRPASGLGWAAMMTQKPAGVAIDYALVTGQTWDTVSGGFASWDAVALAYPTWDQVEQNLPAA